MRVAEGLKTFGAMKSMFNVRSVSLSVKRQLYEKVVMPTGTYRAEIVV